MAQLLTPSKLTVMTKDGEVTLHITLDININLNSNGVVSGVSSREEKELENDDEKTIWAIPDFTSGEKVKFGKKKE